ncbi:hypothetical protein OU995_23210 [Roseateles sp. SL47]|uniref:RHS repeat domain-containing protein n=1 Tax=Roseateles sp. SL47 TaxID=2995138 RepID=UPI0022711546|nr:RHS repeat-associated core domain-containing protein [Roseateles sp. SL47]WAC72430.1 hypothetical protein OU995_23210 [Roseateles sp. SL47]
MTYGWTYDQSGGVYGYGVGRLTTATFPTGSTQYGYDAHGRVITRIQTVGTVALTTRYAYDAANHVTRLTYPSGRVVTFSYEAGQLKGISLATDTVSPGQPLISQIQWQAFGPARSWLMHMASGTQAYERVFDTYGRLVRYPLNGVVRDLRYDAANRIISYTHLDATTGQATAATQALEQNFGYDELGRLTTISTPAQSWTIGYDANGNRTQVTLNGSSRAYTTSATSNRLEQISNPVRSMSYDAAGNTIADTAMYNSAVYSLDNRLTAITKAGQTTFYSYDAGGQRVSKSNAAVPDQARVFVYDSSPELLGEYAADGTAVQEVVWFNGQPLVVLGPVNSNDVFFSYADHLGAPRILVDQSGAERWRWIAEPFGSTAAEPAPAPSGLAAVAFALRFPGQYFDGETGLNYNYFRDYDSSLGRYVQSDPVGLQAGVNTFAYVNADPLSLIDIKGLAPNSKNASCTKLDLQVCSAKCGTSENVDACYVQNVVRTKEYDPVTGQKNVEIERIINCACKEEKNCPPERSWFDRLKDMMSPPQSYDPRLERPVPPNEASPAHNPIWVPFRPIRVFP